MLTRAVGPTKQTRSGFVLDDGVFQVRSTGGDSALGGDDMDRAVAHELLADLGFDEKRQTPQLVRLVLDEARKAKHALTTAESVEAEVPGHKAVTLTRARFYTGVPSAQDNPRWNHFWNAKLAVLGTRNVVTFSRELRYQNTRIKLPDGSEHTTLVGHEKGVDIRLALDIVRLEDDYGRVGSTEGAPS